MNFSGLVVQLLNGLAGASSLFLVSAGLSLIFGVTRIVNFAHGSFYMLGIYVAYALVERLDWLGFWVAVPVAALVVGALGAVVEMLCCAASTARPSCSSCWPPSPWCW
jgi:branched-chain amino acid transport system permease protein